MLLVLEEEPRHPANALLRIGRQADFVAVLLEAVDALEVLRGIDEGAVGVVDVRAVAVIHVVEVRVVRVVGARVDVALQMGGGIHEIQVAELALHGERGLPPRVIRVLGLEVADFQVPEARIGAEGAVRRLLLAHEAGRDRPGVVQVDPQRRARAVRVDVVVVLFDPVGVVTVPSRGLPFAWSSACSVGYVTERSTLSM